MRCMCDERLAVEYALIDREDAEEVARDRAALRARRQPVRSRASGELVPPYVPYGGWLTEVELVISQGRHRNNLREG